MDLLLSPEGAVLKSWVLITGLAGIGAAIGAYTKPLSPFKTLYAASSATACPEFARMYATWLLLSTCVRVCFFLQPGGVTTAQFWLAFSTYIVALWHFGLEIFIFRTAPLRPGGFAPLMVASLSVIWFSVIALLG